MKAIRLSKSIISRWIPKRKPETSKKDYGHVLLICGSKGMIGASTLCAWGALRGGAGLVTAAVPESRQNVVSKNIRPEAMTLPLPETLDGSIAPDAISRVLDFIRYRKISSLAIGPGLSRSSQTAQFVAELLESLNQSQEKLKGIVLDADGFIALKPDSGKNLLKDLNLPLIVTPHSGEMAKFCNLPVQKIDQNRMAFAEKFAKLYQVVCVLKGYRTVVCDQKQIYVNTTGNPGMAKGGSGDVLSGLIAALVPQIAQTQSDALLKAACAGVYVHGLAGDFAAKEKTKTAMMAGDIAEYLPKAFKTVSK
jgi:NAD(P)H-hydrate epimerase